MLCVPGLYGGDRERIVVAWSEHDTMTNRHKSPLSWLCTIARENEPRLISHFNSILDCDTTVQPTSVFRAFSACSTSEQSFCTGG